MSKKQSTEEMQKSLDNKNLEDKIKKYQVVDWIPLVGTLRLIHDDERFKTLIDRNGKFADYLYALSNVGYSIGSGAFGLIYLIEKL